MKRLIIIIMFCVSIVNADDRLILAKSNPYVLGSIPASAPGITWIHDLKLNENAANTTITNYGTSSTAWAASRNTSLFHSATTDPGGDGSLWCVEGETITTTEAWTAEKFEALIWYAPDDAVSSHAEEVFTNGNHDGAIEANEFMLFRANATDEFIFRGQGNTGSYGSKTTSDFAPTSDTYYLLKLNVDASVSPWTVTLAYSTNGVDFTSLTFGAWVNDSGDTQVAVFNSGLQLGNATYQSECLFGRFKMRSTE